MKTMMPGAVLRCLGALVLLMATCVHAQDAAKSYKPEQLEQWLAPVALYPDALLSQILMASTYPASVVEAAAWSKAHASVKGDDAVKQVATQNWDPSVQSLVAFPEVLAQMGAHPDWVQNVGDAFLAQPEDVMGSVQKLRQQAQRAGHLKSNDQQKVVVQQASPQTTVIQIEPANPQVVYVPSYNPTVVYGAWAYPGYPPPYWPPPPGYYHPVATGLAAGLAFGAGVAVANSLWGGFDWGHNDVNINVNRYNNINVNNRISGNGNVNWNHNPVNRRGTPYGTAQTRQRFNPGVAGADQRNALRGHDASRQNAMQSFDRSTHNGSSPAARGNLAGQGAQRGANGGINRGSASGDHNALANRQAGANRPAGGGNNAFAGVRGGQSGGAPRATAGGGGFHPAGGGGAGGFGGHPVQRQVPVRGGGFHRR